MTSKSSGQTDRHKIEKSRFFLAYRAHRETVKISVAARLVARSNNDIPYHKITQTIQTMNLSMMTIIIVLRDTVEPVYNGHPRDLRNWPLNTGGRLIQDH